MASDPKIQPWEWEWSLKSSPGNEISPENPAAGMVFIHPPTTSIQNPHLSNYFPFLSQIQAWNHQKFPLGNGINLLTH